MKVLAHSRCKRNPNHTVDIYVTRSSSRMVWCRKTALDVQQETEGTQMRTMPGGFDKRTIYSKIGVAARDGPVLLIVTPQAEGPKGGKDFQNLEAESYTEACLSGPFGGETARAR